MTTTQAEDGKAERVRRHLEQLIDTSLQPHDRLPPERLLAAQLDVSRMTVRQALDSLEAEKRVYRVQGSGNYVAERVIEKTIRLTSFTEDMRERGMTPGARLVTSGTEHAGPEVGARLGLSPADAVVRINRIRLADGEPVCLEAVHISEKRVPGLLEEDLSGSLYDLLTTRYDIAVSTAQQRIGATVVDQADAKLLEVAPFSPALVIERLTLDQHRRPLEYTRSLYRADRYSFLIDIER
ncbi:transcriptional regulator, GntR family [Beutenbergia cavernae DSM 12333]|uniref:Transcriptional regulator, GntR family n=1 Tax=Beutenbergia cavernae (strain ATCC BAA-8 / DSM 12333 / CCUG 43141 / JCM 11478 / NBRC 16432 / NCIMB 13614 / HKI 0122) TaxID=471853 RepID=C5BX21_BEUC1|nr:GntR family transcriptional regulator [Beutenbergia cavernae]ACQ78696.1 transcriptional regulator, GntR family [Beutenbergia cavernae DSM 12333]